MLCVITQLCPTLCDYMECSPPGSLVYRDFPGKNTGEGCHALLQGIFPTQGSNPGLRHYRWVLYHLSHQGSPGITKIKSFRIIQWKWANGFKGFDLIDRVPEELWMYICNILQEAVIKTIPKKKKCKKAKWLSEEALQIAEKRREVKAKEKRKDIPIWMQSCKE